jgi:hypothetical protein
MNEDMPNVRGNFALVESWHGPLALNGLG